MRPSIAPLRLAPLAFLLACGEPTAPPVATPLTELPRALSAAEEQVIEGSNRFAFDFLRILADSREGQNVFTSPLSASMAFGMAMNGADGETWTQMRDALGFDGMSEADINAAYRDLIELLRGLDPAVTFQIANSMWARQGFPVDPAFVQRLDTWFDAEARVLDFADPASVDVINDWVADATSGRIETIIDGIAAEVVMYLINAIYFNGDWRSRFDANATAPAPFTTLDGAVVTVPMMAGANARRASVGGVMLAEMPYGADAFSAVVVLPREGAVDSVLEAMTPALWNEWMAALAPPEGAEPGSIAGGEVRFPKFEMDWESGLNDAMIGLGMQDAFDCTRADFTRINALGGLCIGEAKQKTFLKVDEKGTEAAAVTSISIEVTSAGPEPLTVDRPFILAIRERLSGTILFLGLIGNPGAD